MNADLAASNVRTLLKLVGAALVTHGIGDSGTVETIVGGLSALAGLIWSWKHHRQDNAPAPPTEPPPTKDSRMV
jgi:hypothetical protein